MDTKVSTKTKTKTFQNLNKNCPLDKHVEERIGCRKQKQRDI